MILLQENEAQIKANCFTFLSLYGQRRFGLTCLKDKQTEDLRVEIGRERRRRGETGERVRGRRRQSVSVLASGKRTFRRFTAEHRTQPE